MTVDLSRIARVEAALFLADEPISARKLLQVTGVSNNEILTGALQSLRNRYEAEGSPFQIHEIAGGYQLLTRPQYHRWLSRHFHTADQLKLTSAAMETLSIVAYRQPITRAEVDQLRGVQSQEMLNQLIERGLVKVTGRQESLGRPALYGTSRQFLQVFGLKSIHDLPLID
ncbi:SMC-Scp complex subunit ScpB [Telmatocola sphagniphila]|uniref:SMC-Scp complex subunit ScpB n=1 Tax=Telmatocola sphagniphila TaxID=1123043 RepID=UPI001FE5C2B1|nr:SMC-Scp complex subunit ScpB [Telmatocola sphagniphila]